LKTHVINIIEPYDINFMNLQIKCSLYKLVIVYVIRLAKYIILKL